MTITREEILKMPAGREMDALVAEKVMGGTRCKCGDPDCGCWFPPGVSEDDAAEFLPDFSSEMNAAWLVVEKLKGTHVILLNLCETGLCSLALYADRAEFVVSSDSAPLAICRAALLAHVR